MLISTEWGHPKSFFNGLDMKHVEEGHYGTHLNVYDWTTRKLVQKIDLGMEGVMPLEIQQLVFHYAILCDRIVVASVSALHNCHLNVNNSGCFFLITMRYESAFRAKLPSLSQCNAVY